MNVPEWSEELEDELRRVYHAAPPATSDDDSPSHHTGLKAVYDYLTNGSWVSRLSDEELMARIDQTKIDDDGRTLFMVTRMTISLRSAGFEPVAVALPRKHPFAEFLDSKSTIFGLPIVVADLANKPHVLINRSVHSARTVRGEFYDNSG